MPKNTPTAAENLATTQSKSNSETPPLKPSALVVRPRLRRTVAGRLCPNVALESGARLDELAGNGFALVTEAEPTAALRAEVEQRGAVLVPGSASTDLRRWLRRARVSAALVRPDGAVHSTARDPRDLCAALPAFGQLGSGLVSPAGCR